MVKRLMMFAVLLPLFGCRSAPMGDQLKELVTAARELGVTGSVSITLEPPKFGTQFVLDPGLRASLVATLSPEKGAVVGDAVTPNP